MKLMLQSFQKSCSLHLGYLESLVRWLTCPGQWRLEILWGHAPPYMWKFETILGRLVNRSPHRTFVRAIMPLAVMQMEQSKRRAFWRDTKEYVGSDITNCRPLRVCKISGQLVTRVICNFFPKSRWPQWKRWIMACRESLQTNGDKLL